MPLFLCTRQCYDAFALFFTSVGWIAEYRINGWSARTTTSRLSASATSATFAMCVNLARSLLCWCATSIARRSISTVATAAVLLTLRSADVNHTFANTCLTMCLRKPFAPSFVFDNEQQHFALNELIHDLRLINRFLSRAADRLANFLDRCENIANIHRTFFDHFLSCSGNFIPPSFDKKLFTFGYFLDAIKSLGNHFFRSEFPLRDPICARRAKYSRIRMRLCRRGSGCCCNWQYHWCR